MPDARYRILHLPEDLGRHPVSGIWYLASGIWYLVSGIWYLGEWYPALSVRTGSALCS